MFTTETRPASSCCSRHARETTMVCLERNMLASKTKLSLPEIEKLANSAISRSRFLPELNVLVFSDHLCFKISKIEPRIPDIFYDDIIQVECVPCTNNTLFFLCGRKHIARYFLFWFTDPCILELVKALISVANPEVLSFPQKTFRQPSPMKSNINQSNRRRRKKRKTPRISRANSHNSLSSVYKNPTKIAENFSSSNSLKNSQSSSHSKRSRSVSNHAKVIRFENGRSTPISITRSRKSSTNLQARHGAPRSSSSRTVVFRAQTPIGKKNTPSTSHQPLTGKFLEGAFQTCLCPQIQYERMENTNKWPSDFSDKGEHQGIEKRSAERLLTQLASVPPFRCWRHQNTNLNVIYTDTTSSNSSTDGFNDTSDSRYLDCQGPNMTTLQPMDFMNELCQILQERRFS